MDHIDLFVRIARQQGFRIETSRNGQVQIDFGHKKLHAGHLAQLFPEILRPGASIARLIDRVAPGRPCTHRPTRQIIGQMLDPQSTPSMWHNFLF